MLSFSTLNDSFQYRIICSKTKMHTKTSEKISTYSTAEVQIFLFGGVTENNFFVTGSLSQDGILIAPLLSKKAAGGSLVRHHHLMQMSDNLDACAFPPITPPVPNAAL